MQGLRNLRAQILHAQADRLALDRTPGSVEHEF
jgi:hypothetical protein